ncbi:MAG: Putative short-chain dehydrogenase [uncultured Rubellimicrobium sp.]|uniref:Short-chain dehydrogenase n=1 Tax=uncultured Rubellimicrobium sp. TaxID=543078 RepID=A0A6J4PI58_9RHOB|nr:MAG: Putative short-chain dehydrogenase [uncultured Rubellimicrobium sp.]
MRALDLSGRTALVTGGNRGIGLAAVQQLARAGARVTFTARSEENIETAMESLVGVVEGRVCDVTDRPAMADLIDEGFDILVNNAGVIGPIGRIGDVSAEDWARNIETNLVAAFHAIQVAVPGMVNRGGGTIVNLSSGAAHRPMEGWSAYCAGKAGLAMVTACVHAEWGAHGIRAFGFAPGVVDTDMQGAIRASGINPVSQLPRTALAPPDQPGWAIAWLCTPDADAMAGQEVDIRHDTFRRAAGLEPLA